MIIMKRRTTLSLALLFFIFIAGIVIYVWPYYVFLTKTLHISVLKTLFTSGSLKTYNNQVNVLILGIAGGDRTGDNPNLSDTIILANYNFKTNRLTTISIPRDIWSETLHNKINSAYSFGGSNLAKREIETVVGMPIQYAAVIDFDKFKELVDFFGGIDIEVDNPFTDNLFPIAGRENDTCDGDLEFRCRYQTISFTKGKTHMDGATALNFVRSRHAEGNEGSDFAREKRQQKVIASIKNKIVDIAKQRPLNQLDELYNLMNKIVVRDITNQQTAVIAKNIFLKGKFQQNAIVLTEDFFNVPDYSSRYNGMWVLVPKGKDFSVIQNYIVCNLKAQSNCETFKPSPTP